MRIFLDANILFSAGKSNGAIRTFLQKLRALGHTLIADAYVSGEARRNIESKFPSSLDDFDAVMQNMENPGVVSGPLPTGFAPALPEKDRPVLAAAIHLRCDILLTGDKTHFGPLFGKTIAGVTVHSPASLATHLFP